MVDRENYSDELERQKWLKRVLSTLAVASLCSGALGLVAVYVGERQGIVGFCAATGVWGTGFIQPLLDTLTINAAYFIVSAVWFVYSAFIGLALAVIPTVGLWSIAYYAKRSQLAE